MGIIGTTLTKGFKPAMFRNQPVHQFFGHLQAVLKNIDPSGGMNDLFARPFFEGDPGMSAEVKWMTDLSGEPVRFTALPEIKQKEVSRLLVASFEKIRAYAEQQKSGTGIEKDYSNFLHAVSVSPDMSMIFVINGKPVVTHWGYIREGAKNLGEEVFAGWDAFITEIKQKSSPPSAPPPPAPPPPPQEAKAEPPPPPPPKQAAKAPEPTQENYDWVKWLALALAVLIILLLLRRILRQPQFPPGTPGGMSSGQGGEGMSGGQSGGMPGGMPGGQPGGMPGGQPGGMPGGQPGGMPGGQPGGMPGGQPGGMPGGQPGGQPGQESSSGGICPTCGIDHHKKQMETQPIKVVPKPIEGKIDDLHPHGGKPIPSQFMVSAEIKGNSEQTLLSQPQDSGTKWTLLDESGKTLNSQEVAIKENDGNPEHTGKSVTISFRPTGNVAKTVEVRAVSSSGEEKRYRFVVNSR